MNGLRGELKEMALAVVPISVAVLVLQFTFIRMPAETLVRFLAGAVMVIVGLALFLQGVKIGLLPVGSNIGSRLAEYGNVALLLGAAFVISFVVTVAEPDVRVLSQQVDSVSDGHIDKGILIVSVALGVAIFTALAMLRLLLRVPLAYLVAGGYLVILVLSFFAPRGFVPIAMDSGGVTTGPMTVPFLISLGIGFSTVLGGRKSFAERFGFIGLASIGPIISVMILGVAFG